MVKKIVFIIILLRPDISYAYLDPGTGTLLLQGLVAALAAAGAAITVYWNKLKSLFSKFSKKKNDKDHNDLSHKK